MKNTNNIANTQAQEVHDLPDEAVSLLQECRQLGDLRVDVTHEAVTALLPWHLRERMGSKLLPIPNVDTPKKTR